MKKTIGIVVIICAAIFIYLNEEMPEVPPPPRALVSNAQAPAVASVPNASLALYGCKQWTETHSKLGVGEIVDQYEVDTKKPLPKDRIKVAIKYRAQGSGLLMISTCEYQWSANLPFLVNAESRPL